MPMRQLSGQRAAHTGDKNKDKKKRETLGDGTDDVHGMWYLL